jgi:hypothetical protein
MLLWTQLARNTMCVFYCTNHKYILQLCSRNGRSKCTADKKSVSYFWTVFLTYTSTMGSRQNQGLLDFTVNKMAKLPLFVGVPFN